MIKRLYVVYDNHGHSAQCCATCPEEAIRKASASGTFHFRAKLHFALVSLYTKSSSSGNNSTYLDLSNGFGRNGWL